MRFKHLGGKTQPSSQANELERGIMQGISTWMWLVLGRYSIAMHVKESVDLPSDASRATEA